MEPELNKCVSKHVRINNEVSYKEAEPLTWSSSGSSYSSDSLDLSFGEKDVLRLSSRNGTSSLPEVSPRGQGMGKPLAYDPNRIPAFVFSSKSAGPMDWSVASNESLFSIHMGNNSFSKDLPILLAKSQELGKLDEITANFQSGGLPPVSEAACPESKTAHTRKPSGGKIAPAETSKKDSTENLQDRTNQNLIPSVECRTSAIDSFHADGLAKDDTRNKLVIVEAETEKQRSLPLNPADSEKRNSQPQTPVATAIPNAAGRNWLSCFSCFSGFSGFTCRPLCCRRPTISS